MRKVKPRISAARAGEAELLGERGEDEVGGALGDELQVRLRALHEALAGEAARADRDAALDDVKAPAERVLGRVEQRADALLLEQSRISGHFTSGWQMRSSDTTRR